MEKFKYKLGGKNGPLIEMGEAPDLVVIRTEGKRNLRDQDLPEASVQAVAGTVPVAAFPEAKVTVYRCVDKKHGSALARRNAIRGNLKGSPGVRFAGRVLKSRRTG